MKEKIKELAKKHKIPEVLLNEAIAMERERVTLQNRRLVPKLIKLIEDYLQENPNFEAGKSKK